MKVSEEETLVLICSFNAALEKSVARALESRVLIFAVTCA